ncbi:zinc finger protein 395 [Eublepharis macularius]|uniref:Zinc finger protein 395 n=1 Tax=Eublepharis macularius TaxID=481883 RepID=A0AA97JSJ2_EUBMA|nr:zinc finger protein 395 [Eublepharis macularius]XP_054844513.1 zinc finger protein 395 [Eublepharis macularius]
MASVLSRRLGKRSLLGARISAPPLLGDGVLVATQIPPLQPDLSKMSSPLASYEDNHSKEQAEESANQNQNWQALQPGQKVYVFYNGQENAGLVDHHDLVSNEVKVLLLEQGFHICRKATEVRLAEVQVSPLPTLEMDHGTPTTMGYSSLPVAMEHSPTTAPVTVASVPRSVSRNIDVPKRKSDAAVDMDEMMAAMVLTSLSCSPVVQSPPNSDTSIPASQAACDVWKESGDMSDGGSSTTSGHWSGGSGISTPSPPHSEASPKYASEAFSSPRADDGFETDSDPFVFEEPAPRKRKNSVKVMYKCLWPSCGKVLRSIVGIKRHVKTQHLGDGANSDQRKREEDFYYTEMQVKEEAPPEPVGTVASPPLDSSPAVIQQALSKPEALVLDQATPLEPPLPSSALSQSAPSSFWHIQADHAYQALPSIQIPVSPHIFTSISWAAATSTIPTLSPVRSRSLSFSEQQQQQPPPILKSHLIVASPPRAPSGTRKVRGEAKKCRKVYGIEHRDQWCTACRWKKACQRFLD